MRIYLVGYMYAGKTTIGKALSKKLGCDFLDLDNAFEEHYKTSIPLFFEKYGEEAFRILESKILQSTKERDNVVVSTGGGTPCYFDNMDFINQNGVSVYLHLSVGAIISRMERSKKVRPVLAHKSLDECKAFIAEQLGFREPFYSKAQVTVEALSLNPQEIADKILEKV